MNKEKSALDKEKSALNKIVKAAANISMFVCVILFAHYNLIHEAHAEASWQDIKPDLYQDRAIEDGRDVIILDVPYRAQDDRVVPISLKAKFTDGRKIKSMAIIIDENPMPLSARAIYIKPKTNALLAANMRFNGPSPMRAIVEDDKGVLYMVEKYVKTTGLGACASPPVTGMEEAMATLGQMELQDVTQQRSGFTPLDRRAKLKLKHPNLTGLQIDQITLHYILPRFITKIEIYQGDKKLMKMDGSISLSENPEIDFDYRLNGGTNITVIVTDSDNTVFKKTFPFGASS